MKVEFTYMSKDGRTPIHAVRWIPESGRCRAILQIVHGMTEFIERYAPFAEYLAAHDFLASCTARLFSGSWACDARSRSILADFEFLKQLFPVLRVACGTGHILGAPEGQQP